LKHQVKEALRLPNLSPPARGRGLKQDIVKEHYDVMWSPPARGRGLKPALLVIAGSADQSPPARGRGLKLDA